MMGNALPPPAAFEGIDSPRFVATLVPPWICRPVVPFVKDVPTVAQITLV
jgi:hypothetical protein